jgi:hypothetical protein
MVLSPTAARFTSMLESLYGAIEDRDPTGYRLSASDGWHQARAGNLGETATEHLETWIEISGSTFTRAGHELACIIHVAARSTRDDDSVSQGAIHAAALDLVELLTRWRHDPTDARSIPLSHTVAPLNSSGDWYEIAITATIHLSRGV